MINSGGQEWITVEIVYKHLLIEKRVSALRGHKLERKVVRLEKQHQGTTVWFQMKIAMMLEGDIFSVLQTYSPFLNNADDLT